MLNACPRFLSSQPDLPEKTPTQSTSSTSSSPSSNHALTPRSRTTSLRTRSRRAARPPHPSPLRATTSSARSSAACPSGSFGTCSAHLHRRVVCSRAPPQMLMSPHRTTQAERNSRNGRRHSLHALGGVRRAGLLAHPPRLLLRPLRPHDASPNTVRHPLPSVPYGILIRLVATDT